MAIGTRSFRLELIAPEHPVAVETCTFAVLPAWDGQIGVLARHSPLVCKLGTGELRAEIDGRWRRFFLRGGFAEVTADAVVVLTEEAIPAGELKGEELSRQLAEAQKLIPPTPEAAAEREQKIAIIKQQLDIADKAEK